MIANRTRTLFLGLAAFVFPGCASSVSLELGPTTPAAVGLDEDALAAMTAEFQDLVDDGRLPGTVTVVARHGRLAHVATTGWMNAGTRVPMREDAIFRIYSMTKPVTSVVVLALCEEGLVELDDPISAHLGEFEAPRLWTARGTGATAERPITVRDLLRHTSGVGYGFLSGEGAWDRLYLQRDLFAAGNTTADLSERVAGLPLLFEPGTGWVYGVSHDVLARLVEVVTGQTFDVVLEERIFGPLGMQDTGYFVAEDQAHRLVSNHTTENAPFHDPEGTLGRVPPMRGGGSGLVSTAADYLRFAQMLLNRGELDGVRILQPASVAELTRDQLPESVPSIQFNGWPMAGVGFGLGVSVPRGSGPFEGDYGWGGAASTTFVVSPSRDLVAVCMVQQMPMNTTPSDVLRRGVDRAVVGTGE